MTFSELVRHRRSCRKFTDAPIPPETLRSILDDALTAPSSKNVRSTRFMVVGDPETLERISEMRDFGSSFVRGAKQAVVVLGDTQATDLWRENCAISATLLQLSAETQGLGSCWVHVHGRPRLHDVPEGEQAEEYLARLLEVPEPLGILCVVALGYPAEPPRPHRERDDSDKIVYK